MRKFIVACLSLFLTNTAIAIELKGELTQGSMIIGQAQPGSRVQLNGEWLRVTRSGQFVFGFGRDAVLSHTLTQVNADGSTQSLTLTLKKRDYQIQRIEGVEQKYVTPPQERLDRIKREAVLVRTARSTDSSLLAFLSDFILPAEGPITGVYGSQRFYNGQARNPHFGLDIAGPTGTQIVAPADGVITLAEDDLYYSGGTLIMDHGYGISSTFLHLSKILVNNGDTVKKGQVVAEMGATGRVTGPHLDWRINWYHERLDPQLLFPDLIQP